MGGGRRQRAAPGAEPAGMRAAIDDQPLPPDRQLEAERAGMGIGVEARRRRLAGIHHQRRAARQHALEPAMGSAFQRAATGVGLGQHRVGHGRIGFPPAVEQRQPAVAVAEEAERRGHAVDGVLKHFRDLVPRRAQDRPDVDQVAQHQHVAFRIALDMAAVGQHLGRQFAVEQPQRLGKRLLAAGQAQPAERQSPDRAQQCRTLERSGDDPRQMRGLARQTFEHAGAEGVVGALAVEIVLPDPVGDARPQHIGRPGSGVPAVVLVEPARDQRPGLPPRHVAADGAQVAQPVEAVHGGDPRPPIAEMRHPDRLVRLHHLAARRGRRRP